MPENMSIQSERLSETASGLPEKIRYPGLFNDVIDHLRMPSDKGK